MHRSIHYILLGLAVAACGASSSSSGRSSAPASVSEASSPSQARVAPTPGVAPQQSTEAPESRPTSGPESKSESKPAPNPESKPAAKPELAGRNFIYEARLLYRVAACGGSNPVPSTLRKDFVETHCAAMAALIKKLDAKWTSKAKPFFKKLVPRHIPKVIVYPFGGADLISALAVFPDLTEITTLGLEYAGDPRAVSRMSGKKLERGIEATRKWFEQLVRNNHNRTIDMMKVMNRGGIPGQLIFSLTALAVHGYEPVSLRYFEIARDGSLEYLTDKAIAPIDALMKKRPRRYWKRHRNLFANMEIRFRKRGDSTAPVKVFRSIQGNLENKYIRRDPRVIKHLESKGKITAMTKAASFLLWWRDFSRVRKYLLTHMNWMVSDATGIPNRYARKAGFEQITWGKFQGHLRSLSNPGPSTIAEMRRLWKRNEYRPLDFRFGYPDSAGNHHLMVTRPRPSN